MVVELTYEQCKNRCRDMIFDCTSSETLSPLNEIIGQDRAVKALRFGIKIEDKGFNIFITGLPGTGKRTAIVDFITQMAKGKPVPPDWCYVYNFKDPSRPRSLQLPAGKGILFKREMETFVSKVPAALKEAFESNAYSERQRTALRSIEEERNNYTNEIGELTSEAGFQLQQSPMGPLLVPMIEGRLVTNEEFMRLPNDAKRKIQEKREALQEKLQETFRSLMELDRKAEEAVKNLSLEVASYVMRPLLENLNSKFGPFDGVKDYLSGVQNHILDNMGLILTGDKQANPLAPPTPDPLQDLAVNLIVDNSSLDGAPIVIELTPSYYKMFGAIEKEARFGALITNFTMIKAGACHRANGGYLVIPIEGIFTDPLIWVSLKQTLSNDMLEIEDKEARFGYIATKSLRPEPIPFRSKVILMGEFEAYQILYSLDKEFKELFKVKAEFDDTMERSEDTIKKNASFVCMLCKKENLLPLDASGLAAIIDYSSRIVEDKNKLSTRFSEVADIIREANFYAREEDANLISRKHINRQMEERIYRSNLIQEKLDEMIKNGVYLIDTKGQKVGQVNGLAVLGVGDYAFGRPSKITASVGVGREGIIDIERQAQMGGPTHTKGLMILSGYLNAMFARNIPLGLTARVVFEQSYSGVDGDSASSTELYCILSALAEVEIKQYIAVTGSVSQRGEVQAIGGVNEKVEGFFEVCKKEGLTGQQGCMIPESNVQNLMLKDEVVDAVKNGKFHIYPVRTIEEGIEVLTGLKGGKRLQDGSFEPGSVFDRVQKRLDGMAEAIRSFKE